MFYLGIFTPGESVSLERKIESSIFLCIPRDLNILGKSCTTFVIVKIVRNLSRGRSPCQRVNHVKSGVIYFSAFIFSYDTIHVSGTIHTWNRDLTHFCWMEMEVVKFTLITYSTSFFIYVWIHLLSNIY